MSPCKPRRIQAQHLSPALRRAEDIHQNLDRRSLARSIRTHERGRSHLPAPPDQGRPAPLLCGTALRGFSVWIALFTALALPRFPTRRGRFQCAAMESTTSSSPIPSFLASTTSSSISRPSNSVSLGTPGFRQGGKTTVPIPGRVSNNPAAIRCVITLCAVLGLILSFLAQQTHRRKTHLPPRQLFPKIIAFFAA